MTERPVTKAELNELIVLIAEIVDCHQTRLFHHDQLRIAMEKLFNLMEKK